MPNLVDYKGERPSVSQFDPTEEPRYNHPAGYIPKAPTTWLDTNPPKNELRPVRIRRRWTSRSPPPLLLRPCSALCSSHALTSPINMSAASTHTPSPATLLTYLLTYLLT